MQCFLLQKQDTIVLLTRSIAFFFLPAFVSVISAQERSVVAEIIGKCFLLFSRCFVSTNTICTLIAAEYSMKIEYSCQKITHNSVVFLKKVFQKRINFPWYSRIYYRASRWDYGNYHCHCKTYVIGNDIYSVNTGHFHPVYYKLHIEDWSLER